MTRTLLVIAALLAPVTGIAAEIGGTWQGSYTCNQGLTGLTLTVTPSQDGSAIRGVFRFYQVANPGIPDGCFAMTGVTSGSQISLHATEWLYRPAGYVTVDLAGAVSPDGDTLAGSIFGPNCTSFTLHRVLDDLTPKPCQSPATAVS